MDDNDLRELSASRVWKLISRFGRDKEDRESLLALVHLICFANSFQYVEDDTKFSEYMDTQTLRDLLDVVINEVGTTEDRRKSSWARLAGVLVEWAHSSEWRPDVPSQEGAQALAGASHEWLPEFAGRSLAVFLNSLYLCYRGAGRSRSNEAVFCAALFGAGSKISESTEWSGDIASETAIRTSGAAVRLAAPSGVADDRAGAALWRIRLRVCGVDVEHVFSSVDFHVIEGNPKANAWSRWGLVPRKSGRWILGLHEVVEKERVVAFMTNVSSLRKKMHKEALLELAAKGWIHAVVIMPEPLPKSNRVVLILSCLKRKGEGVLRSDLSAIPDGLSLDLREKAELGGLVTGWALGLSPSTSPLAKWDASPSVDRVVRRESIEKIAAESGLVSYVSDPAVMRDVGLLVAGRANDSRAGRSIFSPISSDRLWHDLMRSPGSCFYVIGDNGEGKSFLLLDLISRLVEKGVSVVALAFSINDRFSAVQSYDFAPGACVYRGLVDGRGNASARSFEASIVGDLEYLASEPERLSLLRSLLLECGFYGEIYLLAGNLRRAEGGEFIEIEELDGRIAPKYRPHFRRKISSGSIVALSELSSGERHIVHLLVVVARYAGRGVAFLVDEPELSLHAKWQRLVPSLFSKISKDFECAFVVATHSPILVAGAGDQDATVYSAVSGQLEELSFAERRSVGRALLDGFKVYTPGSLDLYEDCARIVSGVVEACNDGLPSGSRIDLALEEIDRLKLLVEVSQGQVDESKRTKDMELLRMAGVAVREVRDRTYPAPLDGDV